MASRSRRITIRQQGDGPDAMDVIYRRRAVRDYLPGKLGRDVVHFLASAAVQAPTAMHEEPCVFTVIQDKETLKALSDDARRRMKRELKPENDFSRRALAKLGGADFNIFYNAETLIVIWAKPKGPFAVADCWLAAENLMLAACAQGLGSCLIGFAISTLNTPEWRTKLGMHEKMTAVAPIIVGLPAGEPPRVSRHEPEIIMCD